MPYTLSPSSLRLYKECPKCFWMLIREQKKRPEAIYPSLPFGVDKVLKERFDYYREKGGLPPELRKLGKVKLFDHVLLPVWRTGYQGLQWKDESGNILRGAVDDLLDKEGKLVVLEYVTRGYPLKDNTTSYYQNQLNLYTFLLQKNGFSTEGYAYLLFFHPKSVNWQGDIWFHKELHQLDVNVAEAERLFKEALAVLDSACPESAEGCEFCRWKKS